MNRNDLFLELLEAVKNKKITREEACAALGVSKQTWYNMVKRGYADPPPRQPKPPKAPGKRGRPRKPEPEPRPAAPITAADVLPENFKPEKIPAATAEMIDFLNGQFPHTWRNLNFEHSDASGYWFTFELVNDPRRQTWVIRPREVCAE